MVHNHGTEDGPGLGCPETVIDGELKGLCLRDSVTVPLKHQGRIIGTATVGKDGKVIAEINSKGVGKEFYDIFITGLGDSFSIAHNYAPAWRFPECSNNID